MFSETSLSDQIESVMKIITTCSTSYYINKSHFTAMYWWAELQVDWVTSVLDQAVTDKTDQTQGSSTGTVHALAVNSLIWCRILRGWTNPQPEWRLALDTNHCSPSLWTETIHLVALWNRCCQFSPNQQDIMFDWSGAGQIVPFQFSHNQLTFSQYLIKATLD